VLARGGRNWGVGVWGCRWEVVDESLWTFVAAVCRPSAFQLKGSYSLLTNDFTADYPSLDCEELGSEPHRQPAAG